MENNHTTRSQLYSNVKAKSTLKSKEKEGKENRRILPLGLGDLAVVTSPETGLLGVPQAELSCS